MIKLFGVLFLLINLFISKIDYAQIKSPIVSSVTLACNDTNYTLTATPGTGGNAVYWYSDYLCLNLLDSGLTYSGVTHQSTMLYAKTIDTSTRQLSNDPTQVYVFKPQIPVASIRVDTFSCYFNLIVSQDTAVDSLNIVAMEDATIDQTSPTTNFNNNFLNIRPIVYHTSRAYFITKFDLGVFPLKVRPYKSCLQVVAYAGFAHGNNGNVYTQLIPNDTWSESTVTYNNSSFPAVPNSIPNSNGFWWVWYGFPSYSIAHGNSATMGGSPEGTKLRKNCNVSFNQIVASEYLNDKILSTYHFSRGYDSRYYSKDYKTNASLLPQIFSNFSYHQDTSCQYSWTGPNGFSSNSKNLYNLRDTGNYILTITSPFTGCDTVLNKTVKVIFTKDTTFSNDTICFNDSILFGGRYVSTSGIYYDSLVSSVNCDSFVQITLHVLPPWQDTTFLRDTICWNDSILLGGRYVSMGGIYYDTLVPQVNCDSLVQMTLYVLPPWQDTTFLRDTICWNDSVLLGGRYVSTGGIYYDTLVPQVNCDSLVQTTLYVLPPWQDTTFLRDTICWNDSVLLGGRYVSTGGIYYDTLVPQVNCDSLVQTTLYVLPPWQDTTFLRDTICWNDSVLLGGRYVSTGGIYYDTLVPQVNCDSLVQTTLHIIPRLVVNLGNDTSLCIGFTHLFSLNIKDASYLWQNGDTTSSISASPPGLYYVDVTVGKCTYRDSVNVLLLPSPFIGLGTDTSICFQNGSLVLDAKNIGSSYTWNNGSTSQTIRITKEGNYSVVVTNTDGCSETGQIMIEEKCPAKIYIPNAFSPNDDGINDFFYIKGENIGEIKWYIFNRWGEKIYESNSMSDRWNGTHRGVKVEQEVYTYTVYYKGSDDSNVNNISGHVTVIR